MFAFVSRPFLPEVAFVCQGPKLPKTLRPRCAWCACVSVSMCDVLCACGIEGICVCTRVRLCACW
jgi:hypothetical protein